jgi:hypothetical protein
MRDYLDARHRGVFGPDTLRILVDAFDEAWKSVQDSGAANGTNEAREVLAKYILEAALLGERDRRRLCDGALKHLAARATTTARV